MTIGTIGDQGQRIPKLKMMDKGTREHETKSSIQPNPKSSLSIGTEQALRFSTHPPKQL